MTDSTAEKRKNTHQNGQQRSFRDCSEKRSRRPALDNTRPHAFHSANTSHTSHIATKKRTAHTHTHTVKRSTKKKKNKTKNENKHVESHRRCQCHRHTAPTTHQAKPIHAPVFYTAVDTHRALKNAVNWPQNCSRKGVEEAAAPLPAARAPTQAGGVWRDAAPAGTPPQHSPVQFSTLIPMVASDSPPGAGNAPNRASQCPPGGHRCTHHAKEDEQHRNEGQGHRRGGKFHVFHASVHRFHVETAEKTAKTDANGKTQRKPQEVVAGCQSVLHPVTLMLSA